MALKIVLRRSCSHGWVSVDCVDVRAAEPADLVRVLQLAAAFYMEGGFSTPVSGLRHNLAVLLHASDARLTIARRRRVPVGFAITTFGFGLEHGAVAELEDLYVEPAHRRAGVATTLIEDSAEWARSRGCRTLEVVIAPNGNNVARLVEYCAHRDFTDEGRRLLTRNLEKPPRSAGRF